MEARRGSDEIVDVGDGSGLGVELKDGFGDPKEMLRPDAGGVSNAFADFGKLGGAGVRELTAEVELRQEHDCPWIGAIVLDPAQIAEPCEMSAGHVRLVECCRVEGDEVDGWLAGPRVLL